MGHLAQQMADAMGRGCEIVLVSSGAIACGWPRLGLADRPRSLPELQAAAAAGQITLMRAWEEAFNPFGLVCGQVLLTHDDVAGRQRFLNARDTLETLLQRRVVPVVNENDTVSVDEIRFGDNDNLSADVASLVDADLLLILTQVPGLMTADPSEDPGAELVVEVTDIDSQAAPIAGGSRGAEGTGGMITKVEAARKAGHSGIPVVMAGGLEPDVISQILAGDEVGTLFVPAESRMSARKHWIAFTLKPRGRVVVDDGARVALVERGKSLLPRGVTRVEGDFERGAPVSVLGPGDVEFARGLAAYSAEDLRRIAGHNSAEIIQRLGYTAGVEVIHRDDLALLQGSAEGRSS
jgi:glutamate 5-kinase